MIGSLPRQCHQRVQMHALSYVAQLRVAAFWWVPRIFFNGFSLSKISLLFILWQFLSVYVDFIHPNSPCPPNIPNMVPFHLHLTNLCCLLKSSSILLARFYLDLVQITAAAVNSREQWLCCVQKAALPTPPPSSSPALMFFEPLLL